MSLTTLSESTPRARKRFMCRVCQGTIGVGDIYRDQVNADGANVWHWRSHLLCYAVLWRLWEQWWDEYDEPDPADVRDVLTAAFAVIGGFA